MGPIWQKREICGYLMGLTVIPGRAPTPTVIPGRREAPNPKSCADNFEIPGSRWRAPRNDQAG